MGNLNIAIPSRRRRVAFRVDTAVRMLLGALRVLAAPLTVAVALLVAGGVLVTVGAGKAYEPAGWIVGGVLLAACGLLAFDVGDRR